MDRILEPEVMNDQDQVNAYAEADFSDSNNSFVDTLVHEHGRHLSNVLDLGCGPGHIDVLIIEKNPDSTVTAVDASAAMIEFAKKQLANLGIVAINLVNDRLPGLELLKNSFSAVISKDLLHHIPDPHVFWEEVKELAAPGALVYVMDLFRPQNKEEALKIVNRVAKNESEILRFDFYNSLLAAFTVEEIQEQLEIAGLTSLNVRAVSDRHMIIKGFID